MHLSKRIPPVLMVIVAVMLVQLACTPGIMKSLGYISLEEHDAVVADLVEARVQIDQQNAAITSLEGQTAELEGQVNELQESEAALFQEVSDLQGLVDNFRTLLCERGFEEAYRGVTVWSHNDNDTNARLWDFRIYFTQWMPSGTGEVEGEKYFSLITTYELGDPLFIVDTLNNCLIINPEWLDVGQMP